MVWFGCASSKEQALQSPGNWLGIPSVCILKYAIHSKGSKMKLPQLPSSSPAHGISQLDEDNFDTLMRQRPQIQSLASKC